MAKLGYTGVYTFFLSLLKNIDCGYSLEPLRRLHILHGRVFVMFSQELSRVKLSSKFLGLCRTYSKVLLKIWPHN